MIQTNFLDILFVLSFWIYIFRNFHLNVGKNFVTVELTE